MDRLRALLSSVYLLTTLFFYTTSSSSSVLFWRASSMNVSLPNHFRIDEDNGVLVIAANNSVCHLSFDFTNFTNVLQAEPDPSVSFNCEYIDARSNEECQNYHHVLQLPQGPGTINNVPLNQTVLTCGSNAFSPHCYYRRRNNLQVIADYSGLEFCSVDMNTDTTSLWTSNNRLVSASKTLTNRFGIRVSESPYNGEVAVATRPNDNFWINKSPQFVSMYEIGEHIYIFFREEAVEVTEPDKVIYSRVARVCKNDVGTNSLGSSDNNVFLTFIKARMSCSSGSGIPFHYNNIQDTFLLQSGSYDGKTNARHLYAVFTSSDNGPVGSAICIFTFYSQTNDLGNVFQGNYKRRSATDGSLTVQDNFEEFSCEAGSRTVEDARDIQFMESPVRQSNGPHPLLELDGYAFSKIVVDQMTDANGTKHEVMFVAAHKDGQLFLIKGVYSSTNEQTYHVISTTRLGTDTKVTKMTLKGSGADAYVYIGTENGIYRVPTADCACFTDCCSCVSARDPYCTYSLTSHTCRAVGSTNSDRENLLQDFARGNSSLCFAAAMSTDSTSNSDTAPSSNGNDCSTGVATTTVATTELGTDQPGTTITYVTGTIGGLVPTSATSTVNEHIWTIVGAVSGFIGGVVIGIILMAFFYQRGNVFRKASRRPRRRTSRLYHYDSGEEGKDSSSSRRRRQKTSGATEGCKKEEEFLKNNHELSNGNSYATKSNEYTNVPPKQNGSAKFVLNPVPTTKGAKQEENVSPPAKFVLNPVPTTKGARQEEPNVNGSPAKFMLNPVPTTKGARQEVAPQMGNGAAAASKYCYNEPVVGKGSSVAAVRVAPPTAPKTKSASALMNVTPATSYSRRMTSSGNHSDLNLKSNLKLEESLTNHDRDTYGRNLLARQPSVDTTHKLSNGNGRTRLHAPGPVMQVSYDRRHDFVSLSDVPRTSSQC